MDPQVAPARFGAPTEIVHGPGSVAGLAAEIRRLGGTRAFVVTDPGLVRAGIMDQIIQQLDPSGLACGTATDVPADPTFEDVDRIVAAIRLSHADTVVSVGSGSVLAAGRSAAVVAAHDGPSIALAGVDKATRPPLLSICVPTTAGSGGEVSRQATITDGSGHKSGIQGWAVAARLAILDAELLVSAPRRQTVASGIDALTHALEAYVSRRATPLTDALALSSFETIFRDLPVAADSPRVEEFDRLLLASTMANIACGNAGLGLVHGLNKGITYLFHTGRYTSVSYGELHSILLPWVMAFNAPAALGRYARLAHLMGVPAERPDAEAVEEGIDRLKAWLAAIDAPRRLPWDGCASEDLDIIVNDVLGRAMAKDNPRESSDSDLKSIVLDCVVGW